MKSGYIHKELSDSCELPGFWDLLRAGDNCAYRYLFDRYYPALCSVAYSYVKDHFVSEALVDDVIFNIWQKRSSLNVTSSMKYYLLVSVRNKCREYLRSAAVSRREPISSYDECEAGDDFSGSAEEELIGKELHQLLKSAIEDLPDETRRVFELSRYEGYSYDEISRELGISVNTVKYHIKRALSILRSKFSEYLMLMPLLMQIRIIFDFSSDLTTLNLF